MRTQADGYGRSFFDHPAEYAVVEAYTYERPFSPDRKKVPLGWDVVESRTYKNTRTGDSDFSEEIVERFPTRVEAYAKRAELIAEQQATRG